MRHRRHSYRIHIWGDVLVRLKNNEEEWTMKTSFKTWQWNVITHIPSDEFMWISRGDIGKEQKELDEHEEQTKDLPICQFDNRILILNVNLLRERIYIRVRRGINEHRGRASTLWNLKAFFYIRVHLLEMLNSYVDYVFIALEVWTLLFLVL